MTFPFSKAFSLSAAAAISTVGIAISQPAEAITVTRSASNPTSLGSYSVSEFNFNLVPAGNIGLGNNVSGTPSGLIISNTGNGNLEIYQASTDNRALQASNGANRAVTFDFTGLSQPLAYFGVKLLNPAFPGTISFFNGSALVGSPFSFASIVGSGNYFNFYSPLVGERFNKVVISGRDFQLDDIAYAVPTPALLPGLVGMGVAALRKRKAEEEQEA